MTDKHEMKKRKLFSLNLEQNYHKLQTSKLTRIIICMIATLFSKIITLFPIVHIHVTGTDNVKIILLPPEPLQRLRYYRFHNTSLKWAKQKSI